MYKIITVFDLPSGINYTEYILSYVLKTRNIDYFQTKFGRLDLWHTRVFRVLFVYVYIALVCWRIRETTRIWKKFIIEFCKHNVYKTILYIANSHRSILTTTQSRNVVCLGRPDARKHILKQIQTNNVKNFCSFSRYVACVVVCVYKYNIIRTMNILFYYIILL